METWVEGAPGALSWTDGYVFSLERWSEGRQLREMLRNEGHAYHSKPSLGTTNDRSPMYTWLIHRAHGLGTTGGALEEPCLAHTYTSRRNIGVVGNRKGPGRTLDMVLHMTSAAFVDPSKMC